MYLRMSSERESFPSCTSNRAEAATNCLVSDPASKTEFGLSGTLRSRSAEPWALLYTTWPSLATAHTHPGDVALVQLKILSISAVLSWANICNCSTNSRKIKKALDI